MGSRACIRDNFGLLRETCAVVSESVPSSIADLLSLAIHNVEAKSQAYILVMRVGALESTLLTHNSRFGEL